MSFKSGCLKPGLFGCLGILALLLLATIITGITAWSRAGKKQVEDQQLQPMSELISSETSTSAPDSLAITYPGRLILNLGQGDFEIQPGQPGEGIRVEAQYDKEVYLLEDDYQLLENSQWQYTIDFHRTISGFHALFRKVLGAGHKAKVTIYIAPDLPVDLAVRMEEGGMNTDLGGLWISDADFYFKKGGIELEISEPLYEPMKNLTLTGFMGGINAHDLGNASPTSINASCSMGGANLHLDGDWSDGCDINASVKMGGMNIFVPEDMACVGVPNKEGKMLREEPEVPLQTLRFNISQNMGEILVH